jgi:palmitoyltransferase
MAVSPTISPQGDDRKAETASPGILPQQRIRRRKLFSVGSLRFRFSRTRLIDAIVDGMSCCVETMVYLIGPLLILLALWIIGLLTYSFFTILLPMLQDKYDGSSLQYLYLGLHCSWVLFLLVNVLFNYALCVTTRHVGPQYDKVIRELAVATDMVYPETPAQLAQYRHDFEDRMFLRMRRRQARSAQRTTTEGHSNGMTHRKMPPASINTNTASTDASAPAGSSTHGRTTTTQPLRSKPQQIVRHWMLMGPLEWGYCNETSQPKPPRSHYDHVTKQLVLNLDHYCPWMFNSSKLQDPVVTTRSAI